MCISINLTQTLWPLRSPCHQFHYFALQDARFEALIICMLAGLVAGQGPGIRELSADTPYGYGTHGEEEEEEEEGGRKRS